MPLHAADLAQLIERHAASLRLWIRWRCPAGEDVVQEAFCRLAVLEPPPDNAVAWLYQACRNLADKQRLSSQRRQKREEARAQPEAEKNAVDPLELAEVLAAVEKLEDDLRDVLVARIWGQLTLEEIGKLLNISTATAHRRYQAALLKLKSQLESPCEKHP